MTTTPATPEVTAFAVCVRCAADLAPDADGVTCTSCGAHYEVRNSILDLLPEYTDDLRSRYADAYERLARDDLHEAFEHDRRSRHEVLLEFIGDTRGKRVLDIGSSDGAYLQQLEAEEKVALDLARPFLEAIPPDSGIARVCSDAELLPVRPGYFDVLIISDVVEHVLEPERLMERVKRVSRPDTRIIVHVPWKEDLGKYADSAYEFTHLRTFNEYTFATLWRYFSIRRQRATYPILEEPIIFQLKRFIPLRLYDRIARAYFDGRLMEREYERRARWIRELPRRERWLLKVYPPAFMMFELRLRPQHAAADAVRNSRRSMPLRLPRVR